MNPYNLFWAGVTNIYGQYSYQRRCCPLRPSTTTQSIVRREGRGERIEEDNTMSFCSSFSSPQSLSLFSKPFYGDKHFSSRFRASAADVPDFLSADWYINIKSFCLSIYTSICIYICMYVVVS